MAESEAPTLPPLRIRISTRARRPSIRVSAAEGVVVVVPSGTDRRTALGFVRQQREWLMRAVARLERHHGPLAELADPAPPGWVRLPAVGRVIRVRYRIAPGPARCRRGADDWHLSAPEGDRRGLRRALQRGVGREARAGLEPWLRSLSDASGLTYGRLQIRGQRTLWGSCSQRGSISLNWKLLFLPPELVEYVLLHELAHTVHPDHSSAFWALLEALCPHSRRRRAALRTAPRLVPAWAERR